MSLEAQFELKSQEIRKRYSRQRNYILQLEGDLKRECKKQVHGEALKTKLSKIEKQAIEMGRDLSTINSNEAFELSELYTEFTSKVCEEDRKFQMSVKEVEKHLSEHIDRFFDPDDGYMLDIFGSGGVSTEREGIDRVITLKDGTKYRVGLIPI